jgi:co-chaperonin GroES (HSP10)
MAAVQGKLIPLRDKVIVHNMHFGEQRTSGGLIVLGDDGKDRGIYPRWGQVFGVGPEHKEEFGVGDWILVEHGRWTRGILLELENGEETTIRMVDNSCIIMWSKDKPSDTQVAQTLNVPTANEAYRIYND